MPLRVNSNIAAINARRHINANQRDLNLRLERLSSGLRLNRAGDDAAGLAVREGMRSEIVGLKQNVLNSEQAMNLIQVAEGSLNEVNGILIRMQELATQSSNSTLTDTNREAVQGEFNALTAEIDRIAQSTTYNDQNLLTGYGNTMDSAESTVVTESATSGVTRTYITGAQEGIYTFEDEEGGNLTLGNGIVTQTISLGTILDSGTTTVGEGEDAEDVTTQFVATGTQVVANFDRLGIQVTLAGAEVAVASGQYLDTNLDGQTIVIENGTGGVFQVGPKDQAHNRIEISILNMKASESVLNLGDVGVTTATAAQSAITRVDSAILAVSTQRGHLGAIQNRLGFAIGYTENEIENISASEASISDADIAEEVTAFTRAQILSQAATAMLAQANVLPPNALALLQ
ncbi:MAG: flagellin [Candidatus Latescibacterota bacterium]|nr:flagellin [Candidatus Latescibacterota bacterium]